MRFIVWIALLFSAEFLFSETTGVKLADSCEVFKRIEFTESAEIQLYDKKPNPVLYLFKHRQRHNKRVTAALLAFPFPFGIVGLHRIYLGTKPYVPVAYIASLGGVFGVLPFIDFWVLLLDKDIEQFSSNGKVLMWVR
ncbi:MAG: NINE protein [Bacteroidia bacterium]